MRWHQTPAIIALLALGFAIGANAEVTHDESINGDLSGDGLAPTSYSLDLGVNTLIATSVYGDREYVTLSVPVGLELIAINHVAYEGEDGIAFIGVQGGSVFTEPPKGTDVTQLLGWSLFGRDFGTLGTDILDNIGNGASAIGFTPPLPAGDYTYWIQQTSDFPCTYQLDFVVAPEPGTLGLFALLGLIARRRRTNIAPV